METIPAEIIPAGGEAHEQSAAAFLEERGILGLAGIELLGHDGKPISLHDAIELCSPMRDQVEASLALANEYAPEDIPGFMRKALNSKASQASPEAEDAKKKRQLETEKTPKTVVETEKQVVVEAARVFTEKGTEVKLKHVAERTTDAARKEREAIIQVVHTQEARVSLEMPDLPTDAVAPKSDEEKLIPPLQAAPTVELRKDIRESIPTPRTQKPVGLQAETPVALGAPEAPVEIEAIVAPVAEDTTENVLAASSIDAPGEPIQQVASETEKEDIPALQVIPTQNESSSDASHLGEQHPQEVAELFVQEQVVNFVQHLPETVRDNLVDFTETATPVDIEIVSALTIKIAEVATQLHILSQTLEEDSPKTKAVEVLLVEWYEELLTILDVPFDETTIADFIMTVRSETYSIAEVDTEQWIDEGMRNFKRSFSRFAHNLSEAKKNLTQEIGRLILLQSAA